MNERATSLTGHENVMKERGKVMGEMHIDRSLSWTRKGEERNGGTERKRHESKGG